MKLSLLDVQRRAQKVDLVVHSLEGSIYQVVGRIGDAEFLLTENDGRIFRRRSLSAVREALRVLPVERLSLLQRSAYDEMIGQPVRERDNGLELPLSLDWNQAPIRA